MIKKSLLLCVCVVVVLSSAIWPTNDILAQTVGNSADPQLELVFGHLRAFWREGFPEKLRLFSGPNQRIRFLTPKAMENLVEQRCAVDKKWCKESKNKLTLGITFDALREEGSVSVSYIAHGLVDPIFEVATVVHEDCHLQGNRNESECNKQKVLLFKNLFGREYSMTVKLLKAKMLPVVFQDRTIYEPTTDAIEEIRRQLRKVGVEIKDTENNILYLTHMVELLANS